MYSLHGIFLKFIKLLSSMEERHLNESELVWVIEDMEYSLIEKFIYMNVDYFSN